MICSLELIKNIASEAKKNNKTIVFTNGCFDIIHSGHCFYLNEAKKLGDVLIVGLNSDDSVKRLKGEGRPINIEIDRANVLCSLKPVDYVVIFKEDTPLNLIKNILPNILVKGGDYSIKDVVGADVVMDNGGEVIILPFVEGKSTSKIIAKILD